jgi:YbbR domain-containing protein
VRGSWLRSLLSVFFRDFGWKLIALALAAMLWVYAVSEPTLSSFVTVPVQFKNLPEDLAISSEVIESVHLEVRGPASELRAMGEHRDNAVVLDMSVVRPGERTFTIGERDVILPRGTRMVRAIPSQLRFEFEPVARREVPVEVRLGSPQAGYEVAGCEAWPPALTIVGPQSRVARVRAVATDPLDIAQVVGTEEFHVTAYVDDPHVRFAQVPRVAVKVQVRARAEPPAERGTKRRKK